MRLATVAVAEIFSCGGRNAFTALILAAAIVLVLASLAATWAAEKEAEPKVEDILAEMRDVAAVYPI